MNELKIYTKEKQNSLGDLYGIFFEDLNHAADGGLYAEMVRNRAFEFSSVDNPSYRPLTAWKKIEKGGADISVAVENKYPLSEKNPHYLMMDVRNTGESAGIMNLGYNTGFYFEKGKKYRFSFYAKTYKNINTEIRLQGADGEIYAVCGMNVCGEWKKYKVEITPDTTTTCGRLAVIIKTTGKIYIDMVSLFPEDTFRNRPNGMRRDIAELLAALKPKFMRFPGGCLTHDGSLNADDRDSMYRWKNTIGELYDRASRCNNWGYNQSLGIGYYEYFVFCEDIGAKPIPILPAGYNPHSSQAAALDDMEEWIQDALDLIEFANGDASTEWGKKRAELGHPEPFGLEYLGIGNEEIGREFFERYSIIHKAVRAKYPEIKLINTSGPFQGGEEYERGWTSARENGSDLVDEHYYQSPEWFIANNKRYDNFRADDPKVFLGEYATWGNTYYNALAEASFMTALERNAHAVALACYAPLLCNSDYVNWSPDMIWFDNSRVYPTANYYVQKMFMTNQGTHTLKMDKNGFERTKIRGESRISGDVVLCADNSKCDFWDISITDDISGEVKKYDDIPETAGENVIDHIESEQYTIRFKAKRISGNRGFMLCIRHTPDILIRWVIGGWANSDSEISSVINGRGSSIDHKVFTVDSGVEYSFELKINGREVTAYINGVQNLYADDHAAEIEELYVSACTDEESGEIIIKAVNLQNEDTVCRIELDGISGGVSGKTEELSGYAPDDKNSFDKPDLIKPVYKDFASEQPVWEYNFAKNSVTVFSLKANEN